MKTASHLELRKLYKKYREVRPCYVAGHWRAESFRATAGKPMPVRRAMALNAVLERAELPVFEGEWIVGLGTFLRMASAGTIDEATLESDAAFLKEIGSRDFLSHFDHHAPDYPALLHEGFGGVRARVNASAGKAIAANAREFLESVSIALDGASRYIQRWAEMVEKNASSSPYKELLLKQEESLRHMSEKPPRSFLEAIQLVYMYHTMMQLDERMAMTFGRIDQFLYPFYVADKAAGRLDDETALVVLVHFFEKVTVTDEIQNITIGGVKPESGEDATNELSHLVLEACKRVGRPGGNVTARIHKKTPHAFLRKCAETIRTGIGYPAVYNDEVEIPALLDYGYLLEEARDYCFVGCIEVFLPGRMAPWADSRFNLLHCVNLALYRGVDSLNGKLVGVDCGDPESFEDFYQAFLKQMRLMLKAHIERIFAYEQAAQVRAADLASPLMSALVSDCIERGKDVNDGGARWPSNHGVVGMGIGVTADSMMAIRRFVYEEKRFTLAELRKILDVNYSGFERERQLLLRRAPKYGNDDPDVDSLAVRVTADFGEECRKYRTPTGGYYWGMLANDVQNIPAGLEVGASADSRLAGQPLSDAASPTFGRDRRGPTAVIRSVAKLPYRLCPGGSVINMKLSPSALKGDEGLDALAYLIRACFDLGGVQLQFNTIDRELLQEAMARPEDHESLVTRVSGFSAYFTLLDPAVQQDILSRTEHSNLS